MLENRMYRTIVCAHVALVTCFMAGCSVRLKPAPIEDRASVQPRPKASQSVQSPQAKVEYAPPVSEMPATTDTARQSSYVVKQGDTLYSIALEHGYTYRDLVAWNQLESADVIKIGQVLRVAPPTGSEAGNTAVIKSDTIQTKPLETTANIPTSVAGATVNVVSEPQGLKRPYSDSTFQSMTHSPMVSSDKMPSKVVVEPAVSDKKVSVKDDGGDKSVAANSDDNAIEKRVANVDGITFSWPNTGKVTQGFSSAKRGIAIAGKRGEAIVAAADGKVVYAGSALRGYGNLLIVQHSKQVMTAYAHNDKLLVKEGQVVKRGQKIAELGQTDASSPQLGFEVRQQGTPVDPLKYLPKR